MDPLVKGLFAQLHTLVKTPRTERTDTDVDGIHDRLMERLLNCSWGSAAPWTSSPHNALPRAASCGNA
ncbi:MAG: hypothetical protein IPG69_17810 [Flavobacteriales bacterium]|nr:hypothetical protein [Flavobacteriales bacterium]